MWEKGKGEGGRSKSENKPQMREKSEKWDGERRRGRALSNAAFNQKRL